MSVLRREILKMSGWSLVAMTGIWGGSVAAQNARKTAPVEVDWRGLVAKVTRLSVLTDRLVRSQVQRSLNVLVQRADRVQSESQSEATRLLKDIAEPMAATASFKQFQSVAKDYGDFLGQVASMDPKDKSTLIKLTVRSDEVGEDVDKLAAALLKEMGQPLARVLTTTADLQRLTQHNAVHFLMARAGIEEKEQQAEVDKGRADFTKLLTELKAAPLKSSQVDMLLPLLDNQWTLMNKALDLKSRDGVALENVATTSERTLEVLTQLYPAYENLLKAA